MKDFRNLEVWGKAHQLTLNVYRTTKHFPGEERFGLTSQMRRSAASIAANIAEGCGRTGNAELPSLSPNDNGIRLQMTMGSASELEYHLLLSRDLEYVDVEKHTTLNDETVRVKRMLASLLSKIDRDRGTNSPARA